MTANEDLLGAASAVAEVCARIAENQPDFPDTKVGRRQHWVKSKIAAKLRAMSAAQLLRAAEAVAREKVKP